jgi:hypothetical protein
MNKESIHAVMTAEPIVVGNRIELQLLTTLNAARIRTGAAAPVRTV